MYCANKKDSYCAHGRHFEDNGTCYNKFELLLLAETIEHKEGKGRLHFARDKSVKSLWKDIAAYMKHKHGCVDELCWVEKLKMTKVEKSAFKPKLPKEWQQCDKTTVPNNNCMNSWLSNVDLNRVLEQFAQNNPAFLFLGSVPIDFATTHTAMTKAINRFTVADALADGKTHVGVVFNTQPSYMSGEHWICAFIELCGNHPQINFFDSYGANFANYPEVLRFLHRVQAELHYHHPRVEIKKNTVRHQFHNSECGVYCLKFIADRLGAMTFEAITQGHMPDDVIMQDRYKKFFRSEKCRPVSLALH